MGETIRYIVDKLPFAKFCRSRQQRKQKRESEQNQINSSNYFFENSFHTSYSLSSSSSSLSSSSSTYISETSTGKELINNAESSLTQRRGYSLHHSVLAPAISDEQEFPTAA